MKTKKCLSFFLAFCTAFSMVPTAALAEALESNEPPVTYDDMQDGEALAQEPLTELAAPEDELPTELAEPKDEPQTELVAPLDSSAQPKGQKEVANRGDGLRSGSWEGQGTQVSPYLIKDAADLEKLATNVNNGTTYEGTYFKIDSNVSISLNGRTCFPIGDGSRENAYFAGIFDGNGQTITDLSLSGTRTYYGLFGETKGATIKNLTISDVAIDANNAAGDANNDYVGALVGKAENSRLEDIEVTGTITIEGNQYVGGAVGYAVGTAMKNVDVKGPSNSIGYITGSDVRGTGACGNDVGGVVGRLGSNATLEDCDADNLHMVGVRSVGGLVGLASASGAIANCIVSNTEVVCSTTAAAASAKPNELTFGGMIGAIDGSCGAMSGRLQNVSVKSYGLGGSNSEHTRKGIICAGAADNTVAATLPSVDGVTTVSCTLEVGSASELASFRDEVNRGCTYGGVTVNLAQDIDLSGYGDWTPIGSGSATTISSDGVPETADYTYFGGTFDGKSHTISNLTVTNDHGYNGLFGAIKSATIGDLTINGATVSADKYVGAVVGYAYDSSLASTDITGALSIAGHSYVGGVVGYASKTRVSQAKITEATGTVSATDDGAGDCGNNAGGVAGYTVNEATLYVCNVSSPITVSATCQAGGLAGLLGAGSEADTCTVENVTISCATSGTTLTQMGDAHVCFGGLAGAMDGSPVAVTDATVRNVVLKLAENSSLSAENKSKLRVGRVTGGTYGATTFAVANDGQTGTATAVNVAKPNDTASAPSAHVLIDGISIVVEGDSMTAYIPDGVFAADAGDIIIEGRDDLYVRFKQEAARAIATNAGGSAMTLTLNNTGTTAGYPVTKTYQITMVEDRTNQSVYSSSNAAGQAEVMVPFAASDADNSVVVTLVEDNATARSVFKNSSVHFVAPHFSTYTIQEVAGVAKLTTSAGVVTYHTTLESAIAAASSGDTITLLADELSVDSAIGVTESIAIDLNGKKLKRANDTAHTQAVFQVSGNAALTVTSGLDGSMFYGCIGVGTTDSDASLAINGGAYVCGSDETLIHINGTGTAPDAAVAISGGKFDCRLASATSEGIAISGGYFKYSVPVEWCALGYKPTTTAVGGYYTVELEDVDLQVYALSSSLGGSISFNFYLKASREVEGNSGEYAVEFYRENDGTPCFVQKLSEVTEGNRTQIDGTDYYMYRFYVPVTVKDMKTELTLKIRSTSDPDHCYDYYDPRGDRVDGDTGLAYSIFDYLGLCIEKSTNPDMKNLAKAMINYGTFAAHYFDVRDQHSTEPLPGIMYDLTLLSADTLSTYRSTVSNGIEGLAYTGTTLNLLDETSLRMYFTYEGALPEYTVTDADNNALTVQHIEGTNYYFVEFKNISAKDLDKSKSVTLTIGGQTLTWTNSPLGYAYTAIKSYEDSGRTKNENLAYAMSGLYYYWYYANEYFG